MLGNYGKGYDKETLMAIKECVNNAPNKNGHYTDYDWACIWGQDDYFDWGEDDIKFND